MAASDVEAVRELYAAFNRGDYEVAAAMLHDEAELEQPAEMPGAGSYAGKPNFIRGLTEWLSGFEPGFTYEPSEVLAGDHVLLRITYRGKGRGSEVELEDEWFNVWEVKDGRPFRCRIFRDEDEARLAAGLPPR